jgi:hypothetical protein
MQRQCVYAELLADTEFQAVGDEKLAKERKGKAPDIRGFVVLGGVVQRCSSEHQRNAPDATAQGMSELDSLTSRVRRNSVYAV